MVDLGFVGLGLMESRIVKRLLAAGHQGTGYNRTRAKAEALMGAGIQAIRRVKWPKPPISLSVWQ